MKQSDLPDEILNGAYQIFLHEIEKHLDETRIVFCEGEVLEAPELKDATNRFHQIKGGAGFFGLTAIERTAKEIEDILKEISQTGRGRVGALRILHHELEQQISKIPKPSGASS